MTRITDTLIDTLSTPENPPCLDPEALALLPFRLLEQLELPAGYERSFKLSPGAVSANRYLLGVDIALLPEPKLTQLCTDMGMPDELLTKLKACVKDANLVLLGFEDGGSSPIHKIYLEYWDKLVATKKTNPQVTSKQLLHKGFKWRCAAPEKHVITDYHCLPGLDSSQINANIKAIYEKAQSSYSLAPILEILARAYQTRPSTEFIYLQVSEAGTIRDSFDINLYAAGLTVGSVDEQINEVADLMKIPDDKMQRLMSLVSDKPLGHLSAGIGRNGQEYLTVYYEQQQVDQLS